MDLGTTKKISVYSSFLKMTNKKITKFHENLKLIIQIQFTQNWSKIKKNIYNIPISEGLRRAYKPILQSVAGVTLGNW